MNIYVLLFLSLLTSFTSSLAAVDGVVVGSDDQFIEEKVQTLMQAILNGQFQGEEYREIPEAVALKAEDDFPDDPVKIKTQRLDDLKRILNSFNAKVAALASPQRRGAFFPIDVCRRYLELYISIFSR